MAHTPAADEALYMAPRKRSVGGYDVDRVLDLVCVYRVGVLGAGKVHGPSRVLKAKKILCFIRTRATAVLPKLSPSLSTPHLFPSPAHVCIRDHLQRYRRLRHISRARPLPRRSVCLFLSRDPPN